MKTNKKTNKQQTSTHQSNNKKFSTTHQKQTSFYFTGVFHKIENERRAKFGLLKNN